MKLLQNKSTGVIGCLRCSYEEIDEKITVIEYIDRKWWGKVWEYDSLAKVIEDWEDYEEPKSINEIDVVIDAIREYCSEHSYYSGDWEKIKILNIVEDKLKAWRRLKDKGFKFVGITETSLGMDCIEFEIGKDFYKERSIRSSELNEDLDLLFRGEE